MYYIIYETKNLINGKLYRGCHRTETLDDGYLGSGTLLCKAIKKYGAHNFERKILKFCDSIEEMIEQEALFVDMEFVNREDTYNLQTGGLSYGILCDEAKLRISDSVKAAYERGDYDDVQREYLPHTEETKSKISKSVKKYIAENGHPTEGLEPWNKGLVGVQEAWNKGITGVFNHTEETKSKISKTLKTRYETQPGNRKGKPSWCAGTRGMGIVKAWNKGIPQERWLCPHCGKEGGGAANKTRWHFDNCKKNPNKAA